MLIIVVNIIFLSSKDHNNEDSSVILTDNECIISIASKVIKSVFTISIQKRNIIQPTLSKAENMNKPTSGTNCKASEEYMNEKFHFQLEIRT